MIRSSIFILLLAFVGSINAQIIVKGQVLDSQTKAPLAFGIVKIKDTNKGVLTNEDGQFSLICREDDTLTFTYLSYVSRNVKALSLAKEPTVLMSIAKNQLATVLVSADDDYLYDMLYEARLNLKRQGPYRSKTYFMLETSTDDQPIEQIECYYNARMTKDGISDLGLKNGRIGMAAYDNDYFVSLSTTDVVSDYKLTKENTGHFPSNPLQLSKKKLKKAYKLTLIGLNESRYLIKFKPKHKSESYFSGEVWVDADQSKIISLKLTGTDLQEHPFVPIHSTHKIGQIDYTTIFEFDEVEHRLRKIEVHYKLHYENRHADKQKWISTNSVFLFYDHNTQFKLPFYDDATLLSDYDKIVSRPYNKIFWDNNEVLLPSKKVLRYREFFEENGVLLNFDELSQHYEQFANRKKPWAEKRIFRDQINNQPFVETRSRQTGPYIVVKKHNQTQRTDFYELNAQIFLDVNRIGDSLHYVSSTLIDLDKSFYAMKPTRHSTCFINLYFDIVEVHRRKLDAKLETEDWTLESIDTLYKLALSDLKFELFQLKTAFLGFQDADDIKKYIEKVERNLGIDNRMLILPFQSQDFALENNEYDIDVPNEKYFYAINLALAGDHEQSVQYLLEYASSGRQHQWLFHHLGRNYRALEKHTLSCQFFDLCESFGGEITQDEADYCYDKE